MTAIVSGGHVRVPVPAGIPDGATIRVELQILERERCGLTEDEWRDDPEGIAAWIEEVTATPVPELTPEEQKELDDWERFRLLVKEGELEGQRRAFRLMNAAHDPMI